MVFSRERSREGVQEGGEEEGILKFASHPRMPQTLKDEREGEQ